MGNHDIESNCKLKSKVGHNCSFDFTASAMTPSESDSTSLSKKYHHYIFFLSIITSVQLSIFCLFVLFE